MKKNEEMKNVPENKTTVTLEELNRKVGEILAECGECPAKSECEAFAFASAALLHLNHRKNNRDQDFSENEPDNGADIWEDADTATGDAAAPHSMEELNDAVDELVDSLFSLSDKVHAARRYLHQLDELTNTALDYLSAIGVPQLSQED